VRKAVQLAFYLADG